MLNLTEYKLEVVEGINDIPTPINYQNNGRGPNGSFFTLKYNSLLEYLEAYDFDTAPAPNPQVNSDWNATTGAAQILNKPTLISSISDLSDVNIVTEPANGKVLSYNAISATWEPAAPQSSGSDSYRIINGTTSVSIPEANRGVVFTVAGFPCGGIFPSDQPSNNPFYTNVAMGSEAMFGVDPLEVENYSNIGIGVQALYSCAGYRNVAIGQYALFENTTGRDNVAVGSHSLINSTTGDYNTSVGAESLGGVTVGQFNTAIGADAGFGITTGNNNTCLGYYAHASSPTVSNEVTIGNLDIERFRIPGLGFVINKTGMSSANNGEVLTYNAAAGVWQPAAIPSGGGTGVNISVGFVPPEVPPVAIGDLYIEIRYSSPNRAFIWIGVDPLGMATGQNGWATNNTPEAEWN